MIQFKLSENVKLVVRTMAAVNSANVNVSGVIERAIGPVVKMAMERLLQERMANLKGNSSGGENKGKTIKRGGLTFENLFIIDGYKLLT